MATATGKAHFIIFNKEKVTYKWEDVYKNFVINI
jgi:hypothetical protein